MNGEMIQAPGWGYLLPEEAISTGMITPEEFQTVTAGKYAGDADRLPAIIESASMAVRNYCGWHLYPSCECEFTDRMLYGNGRIKAVGPDLLILLPAAHVEKIESIEVDGRECTDYSADQGGLLHIFNARLHVSDRRTQVTVKYVAGLRESMMANIRELIANKAIRGITGTAGVTSETAGGVSISYANSWANGGGAGALSSLEADVLQPYKLGGVF